MRGRGKKRGGEGREKRREGGRRKKERGKGRTERGGDTKWEIGEGEEDKERKNEGQGIVRRRQGKATRLRSTPICGSICYVRHVSLPFIPICVFAQLVEPYPGMNLAQNKFALFSLDSAAALVTGCLSKTLTG